MIVLSLGLSCLAGIFFSWGLEFIWHHNIGNAITCFMTTLVCIALAFIITKDETN